MFCPYCGSEIMVPSDKDTCFCSNCGESIVYTPQKKSVSKTSENKYVKNGDKFMDLNEYDLAFEAYNKAIELDPLCSLGWWGLCKRYLYKYDSDSNPTIDTGLEVLNDILSLRDFGYEDDNPFESNYQHALSTANSQDKIEIQNDIKLYLEQALPHLNKLNEAFENGTLKENTLFFLYQDYFRNKSFSLKNVPSIFKNIDVLLAITNKILKGFKNGKQFNDEYYHIGGCVSYVLNSNNTTDIVFYYGKMIFQSYRQGYDEVEVPPTLTIVDDANATIKRIIEEYNRRISSRLCLECGAPIKLIKDKCTKVQSHYCCLPK